MFLIKSYAEESSILFNASENTYSDVNNWTENALKLDCFAYSTISPNFVLLVKISILIAYSSKGAEDNNCKKQQKTHLVLMSLAIIYMQFILFSAHWTVEKKTCALENKYFSAHLQVHSY